jgi:hypothetical protein
VHNLEHWTHFYTPYGRNLQKQFFGYFLNGEKNGWDRNPKVMLNVRRPGEQLTPRGENEWPLERTDRNLPNRPPSMPQIGEKSSREKRHCSMSLLPVRRRPCGYLGVVGRLKSCRNLV